MKNQRNAMLGIKGIQSKKSKEYNVKNQKCPM